MEFRILGTVEAERDGHDLALGGAKPRALLVMLLLRANQPVSRERLIEGLWGGDPPPSAAASLDSYMSRLRTTLGADRILKRAPGYVLRVETGELDYQRFETAVELARATDDRAAAAKLLGDALAGWRGPALQDIIFEPFANDEAVRLHDRRTLALEEWFEARLTVGDDLDLVTGLEDLVREQPFRERPVELLARALYRAGRQGEALGTLQALRRRLSQELGLEPSPALRQLEGNILDHAKGLGGPKAVSSYRRRTRVPAVAAAVIGATILAAVIAVLTGQSKPASAGNPHANRLIEISASTGRVSRSLELPGSAQALAVGAHSVWAADTSNGTVYRFDPRNGAIIDRVAVGGQPGSVTVGGTAVWIAGTLGGGVQRVDPATGTVTQRLNLGGASASAIAFVRGDVWIADATDRTLVVVDPATGSIRRTLTLDLSPSAVAEAAGAIWVADADAGIVEEVDPVTGQQVASVRVGNGPVALAGTASTLWVANSLDGTVSRIDPVTASISATIPVGSGPSSVVVSRAALWVANQYSGSVSRIDVRSNRVSETFDLGGSPATISAGNGGVWVGAAAAAEDHRGGTLTAVTTGRFSSIDPALVNTPEPLQFQRLAWDTLVTFSATAGPGGSRLVPDLAVGLPIAADGGRTYAFRLRPNIRYSDGRLLRATDFRRAFERLFRTQSPGADYYRTIVGAPQCETSPSTCNLARGVLANDSARTVVFRLRVPDPEFLYKLTVFAFSAPIPPGAPNSRAGLRAIPGTGPYRVSSADAHSVRFTRNRFFREWSHAAQPAGNPDQIVWRFLPTLEAVLREVEQGRADWAFNTLPPSQFAAIQTRDAAQLHLTPWTIQEFAPLNASRPPFDDVRVRQALNFAIDRAKIVRMYGGQSIASPICQPLAPGIAGYRRYCPYTLNPRTDGRWSAPDLRRARALVAASGTRGAAIHMLGVNDSVGVPRNLARYVAGVLRSLGYRVSLHVFPQEKITEAMRRQSQLSIDGDWLPDYPDPSSYLPQFFGCQGPYDHASFCNPSLDAQMRRASLLELQDPRQSAGLWAMIDHRLTDQAAWLPFANLHSVDLVSKRLRNYQFNPVWGFIADQAWVQ